MLRAFAIVTFHDFPLAVLGILASGTIAEEDLVRRLMITVAVWANGARTTVVEERPPRFPLEPPALRRA